MQGKVVGFTFVTYPDKKTGDQKEGWEVHVICDPPKNIDFTGIQCKNLWVSPVLVRNTIGSFLLDKEYIFDYDGSGKYPILTNIIPVSG